MPGRGVLGHLSEGRFDCVVNDFVCPVCSLFLLLWCMWS